MILRALYTQLNRAILLCDVIPDGKLSKLHTFWQAIAQVSEMSFPVVFHTENCAVLSGNPTLSSVYLPTPPWHHLKALNLPKWIRERGDPCLHWSIQIVTWTLGHRKHYGRCGQQTANDCLVFIHHSHTHEKKHRTDKKKTDKPDGKPVLCQKTFSSVFRAVCLHS